MAEYKIPSKKTVDFLYKGIVAFYPRVGIKTFGLAGEEYEVKSLWGGYPEPEFNTLLLNTTRTTSVEKAASVVKKWQEGGGVDRTIPERLDEMVAKLDEEEAKMAAYEKQKLAKEALLESQRAKEVVPEAKEKRAPSQEVSATAEGEAAPPETFSVGIQITPQAGKVFQKFTNRIASAPVRAAIAFAAPTIAAQGQGVEASALTLWTRGVKSEPLEKETSRLETKEAKQFNEVVRSLKNIEVRNSLQTRMIQRAYPAKYVGLLLKAGISQSQVDIFFNSPEAGGATAVPRRSFLGNLLVGAGQQLFGKVASKAISGLVTKAAGAAVTEGVAAGVGMAGGPVTAAISYAATWIANKIIGRVLDFLREHRDVAYALLFLPVAAAGLFFGIPILTVAGGLGIAVSLTGGMGAAVSGVGGAVGGFFGALPSLFVTTIATPVIVALVSIPVVVALILFIINSGAYVVPPSPFGAAFFGPAIECSEEKAPVPFSNQTSSPIARRAWQITADLYQGFWCYWNRSPGDFPEDVTTYPPSYPNLFNEGLFARNPNPSREQISVCGDCMFWCTYLVIKSYIETGNRSLQITLWSPTMEADFRARGKFVSSSNATPENVVPGSVVFFRVASGSARTNHVGLVHSVNQDAIVFLQSNAPTKNGSLVFNRNGRGIISPPGLGVVGIGLP